MGKPDNYRHFDHAMLFAMIDDHLVKNNRKEAARIDGFLMREMADIFALHESLISLRLNRPQNTSRVVKDVYRTEKRGIRRYGQNNPKNHSEQQFKNMGKALVDGFYKGKAPSSEKNQAWLQQSQTLLGFVEGFFKELGNLVRKDLEGTSLEAETIEETLSVVLVQNRTEYLEAIAREEEEIMANIADAEKPAPDIFRDRSTATEGSIRADLVQTSHLAKVKTRPDNSSSSVQPVDDLESLDIATLSIKPVTRLRVSPRTLDVVYLMYPDAQTKSRNITWDDFVRALCDAGFVASNNGGLAVRFELGSEGSPARKGPSSFTSRTRCSRSTPSCSMAWEDGLRSGLAGLVTHSPLKLHGRIRKEDSEMSSGPGHIGEIQVWLFRAHVRIIPDMGFVQVRLR